MQFLLTWREVGSECFSLARREFTDVPATGAIDKRTKCVKVFQCLNSLDSRSAVFAGFSKTVIDVLEAGIDCQNFSAPSCACYA
jgi:hypothetical protein